VTDNLVTMTIR